MSHVPPLGTDTDLAPQPPRQFARRPAQAYVAEAPVETTDSHASTSPDPGTAEIPDPATSGELPVARNRPRSTRRSRRRAHSMLLVIALALSSLWLIRSDELAALQGRKPTNFPLLSWEGVRNRTFFTKIDQALNDRFQARTALVSHTQEMFGSPERPIAVTSKVFVSPSGVPFFTEDFVLPCQYPLQTAAVAAQVNSIAERASAQGRSFTVMITPDKSAVWRDQIGLQASGLLQCADQAHAETMQQWPDPLYDPVLTAIQHLREAEADGVRVFRTGDSHWTTHGAATYAEQIFANLVNRGIAPPHLSDAPQITIEPDRRETDSDLFRMLGVLPDQQVPDVRVQREAVTTERIVSASPSGRRILTFLSATSDPENQPLIPGHTVIVHDSFMLNLENHLAPYFEQLTLVHWKDIAPTFYLTHIPEADHVVIQTVQREWSRRSAYLLPGTPMGDYLGEQFPAGS